ncbi:MAG: Mu-like prophage major head subunit gpT family protein [Alphaproteobacteria bacterium]|nr:Mu-like prophage major head subunit gpT family protein [Alphaproteobacteria bacterium]
MIVNRSTLNNLFTSFKTLFLSALGKATPQWQSVAMLVPSTTKSNDYGWLGKFPNVREWVGDRVVHNIAAHKYTITNKDYELTIGVDRNDIDDDNIGIYSPMFSEMGDAIMAKPDQLVFDLLKSGFSNICYDGQNFFDTDHPVLDENGGVISMANTDGGAGNAWFLLDDSRAVKPIIFQERKKPDFTAMDQDTDEQVFASRRYRYGTHSRCNVGFGFWQLIWGSKQTLDAAHFKTAFETLGGNKGDYGRPLGIRGRKLVVGMSNFEAAKKIVGAKELAGGGDNPWYGMAEVVLVSWLD